MGFIGIYNNIDDVAALGLTGYPLKPYPKPKPQNRRRNTPKYLVRTTPHYLIGAVLIKKELERLNLMMKLITQDVLLHVVVKFYKRYHL